MIEWIKIEVSAPMPSDGQEVLFHAKGIVRLGSFYYPEGTFNEHDSGLVWSYPKVTHWAIANAPDGD